MDAATRKLMQAIDAYMEHPPHDVPDALLAGISETRDMLSAPRYSEESPGEQTAREVAEATMPDDMSQQYYSENEPQGQNVGVFN